MGEVTAESQTELAINGGPRAFEQRQGKAGPKIGVEEFFSIAERFGFTDEAMARLRQMLTNDDLQGDGPNLARYACPFPGPPKADRYEELAREKFQVKHAMATSSGTGALHAAMIAVGAGAGKEVIIPATGFMATGVAAAITGATPVYCDIDESMQIDPTKIEALITDETVAVAPTHSWGAAADMDPIIAVAHKHNIKVIEDCAQSPGASYKGRPVGSMGDVGCFSISAYKIIGGGEGGMVVTNDDRLFDHVRQLAECGGLWREDRFAPPRYEGELFVGTNYRPSELESAVNVVQIQRLKDVVGRTQRVNKSITSRLRTFKEITPQKRADSEGDVGYSLRFQPATHELAAKIAAALRAEGVGASYRGSGAKPDWHLFSDMFPIHAAKGHPAPRGDCSIADDLYNREIRVGIDQWFNDADCDAYVAGINKVLDHYCTADESAPVWR